MALYTQLLHRALVMWYLPMIFHIPSHVQVAKCFSTPLWKRKFDVETSTPCFKTVGNVLLWHLGVGGNGETERVLFLVMKLWHFHCFIAIFQAEWSATNSVTIKNHLPHPYENKIGPLKTSNHPPTQKKNLELVKKKTCCPFSFRKKKSKKKIHRDVLESRISSCASQLEIEPGWGAFGKLRTHDLEDHPSYTPEN